MAGTFETLRRAARARATRSSSIISGTSAARWRWSRAGAKALATGSHPVADANGWPDGQQVPIDFAFANAKRIADAVEVPLTVDFEGAYSADPEEGGGECRAGWRQPARSAAISRTR